MSNSASALIQPSGQKLDLQPRRLDWVEPLKALALIGILWNHIAECFGRGPWFTNPTPNWPDFATRITKVYPFETAFPLSLAQFVGWLGDSCPGVFLLLSGFGLTWAALGKSQERVGFWNFLQRRASRIFPLYIAMHFVILGLAVAVPGNTLDLGERRTLLSLLGLRFTDDLFFKISPSWWFVWTILQLYMLFPLLYRGLRRFGLAKFVGITFGFTFAVRLAALFGVPSQWNLYYWMTGVFCGTRLAEFTAGMAFAACLQRVLAGERPSWTSARVFLSSLACYVVGFGCSLTWYGSVVSNLLVSIGMTGLFYSAWKGLLSRNRFAAAGLTWVGVESFSVFLFHQPPLKWSAELLADESAAIRFAAALGVTLASFPAGNVIRRFVDQLMIKFRSLATTEQNAHWMLRMGTIAACLTICSGMFLLNPTPSPHWEGRGLAVLIGVAGMMAALCDWALVRKGRRHYVAPTIDRDYDPKTFIGSLIELRRMLANAIAKTPAAVEHGVYRSTFAAVFLHLFVFPAGHGPASLALGLVFGVASVGVEVALARLIGNGSTHRLFGLRQAFANPASTWLCGGIASVVLFVGAEASLIKWHPIESNRWGEFPALMEHPTRGYALKPNLDIRLHYNNYDYRLKTNSLGLASPEIDIDLSDKAHRVLVLGDAFSMPEGMPREESWTAYLEYIVRNSNENGKRLQEPIQLVNAGVTGYGPNESLAQFAELAPEVKPEVTIYQFFANEFHEVAQDFENRRIGIGLRPGDASMIERQIGRSQVISHLNRELQGAREVVRREPSSYRRSKALLKLFPAGDCELYSSERIAKVRGVLAEMKQIAEQHSSKFVICYVPAAINACSPSELAYFPHRELTENRKAYDFDRPRCHLLQIARELNIDVIDLTDVLRSRWSLSSKFKTKQTYFANSWHWTRRGHWVAACEIAPYLRRELFKTDSLTWYFEFNF